MPLRLTSLIGQLIARSAIVIAMSMSGRVAFAQAQAARADGAMGVSLTILQPVATKAVALLGFSVDRAGMVRFETSAPVSGPTSQVVMTSISSSRSSAAPVEQAPTMVGGAPARFSYLVDVGNDERASTGQRPVTLRIQFLAVAGT